MTTTSVIRAIIEAIDPDTLAAVKRDKNISIENKREILRTLGADESELDDLEQEDSFSSAEEAAEEDLEYGDEEEQSDNRALGDIRDLKSKLRALEITPEKLVGESTTDADLKKYADIIASVIDEYKKKSNIITNLSGAALSKAIQISLARLRVYFYYAVTAYGQNSSEYDNFNHRYVYHMLTHLNKSSSELLLGLYPMLSAEETKDDLLADLYKKAIEYKRNSRETESGGSNVTDEDEENIKPYIHDADQAQLDADSKLLSEVETELSNMGIDDEFEQFEITRKMSVQDMRAFLAKARLNRPVVESSIRKLAEAVVSQDQLDALRANRESIWKEKYAFPKTETKKKSQTRQASTTSDKNSSKQINSQDEIVMKLLHEKLLSKLLANYITARVEDLPKIDEKIYFGFSNTINMAKDIARYKLEESDPLRRAISGGNDEDASDPLDSVSGEEAKITPEEAIDLDLLAAPNSDDHNFLLKYFSTEVFTKFAAEILDRRIKRGLDNITYYNPKSKSIETKPLWNILMEHSGNIYSDRSEIPISLLSIEALGITGDNFSSPLITSTGELVPVSEELVSAFSKKFYDLCNKYGEDFFDLDSLDALEKNKLIHSLSLNVPVFDLRTSTESPESPIIQALENAKLGTTSAETNKIEGIIAKIKLLDINKDSVQIEKLASTVLSGHTVDRLVRKSAGTSNGPIRAAPAQKSKSVSEVTKICSKLAKSILSLNISGPNTLTWDGITYNNTGTLASSLELIKIESPQKLYELRDNLTEGSFSDFFNESDIKIQKSIINDFRTLIQLNVPVEESTIISSVAILLEAEEAYENIGNLKKEYLRYIVNQVIPIIQSTLSELKSFGLFLIGVTRKIREYRKAKKEARNSGERYVPSEEERSFNAAIRKYDNKSEQTSIHDLPEYLRSAKNKKISFKYISALLDLFEEKKNDPSFVSVSFSPVIQEAFKSLKFFLLNVFDKKKSHGFKVAIDALDNSKSIGLLRKLLEQYRKDILFLYTGGKPKKDEVTNLIDDIINGVYTEFEDAPEAEKPVPETVNKKEITLPDGRVITVSDYGDAEVSLDY